ncbi:MAG: O-acetyl-ADP-ribose deacetylase, partial [Gammaproteobacteria bacterium]
GVYGYPKREAARIALTAMRDYEQRFRRVIACCYSAEDAALYRSMLEQLPAHPGRR